jgi:predicted DNA-binding protein
MRSSVRVRISRDIYTRAKAFSREHDRTLADVIDEAISYWLDTVGEAETETMVEKFGTGTGNANKEKKHEA